MGSNQPPVHVEFRLGICRPLSRRVGVCGQIDAREQHRTWRQPAETADLVSGMRTVGTGHVAARFHHYAFEFSGLVGRTRSVVHVCLPSPDLDDELPSDDSSDLLLSKELEALFVTQRARSPAHVVSVM
jgi:hypothetical protein